MRLMKKTMLILMALVLAFGAVFVRAESPEAVAAEVPAVEAAPVENAPAPEEAAPEGESVPEAPASEAPASEEPAPAEGEPAPAEGTVPEAPAADEAVPASEEPVPAEEVPALRAGWALITGKTEVFTSAASAKVVCFLLKDALVQAEEIENSDRVRVKFVLNGTAVTGFVRAGAVSFLSDAEADAKKNEYAALAAGSLFEMASRAEEIPAEEPEAPVEEPEAPIEEPEVPAEEPETPVEEPAVPAEEPEVPVEEPVAPAEEPEVPVEEPVAPVEEPEVPVEEPVAPVEEPEVPAQEPVAPVEEPEVPVQEPVAPAEETEVTVEEPVAPVEEPVVPTEVPATPVPAPEAAAEPEAPAVTETPVETPVETPTEVPTEVPAEIPAEEEAARADVAKIRAYVERCYTVILGRTGEITGVNDWTNRIATGELGGAAVVRGFVASNEFISKKLAPKDVVTILYQAMLGRAPDTDGLNDWVAHMEVGMTSDAIVAGFAGSKEFGDICAGYGILPGTFVPGQWRDRNYGVTAYVYRAYKLILGRDAEPEGQNNWCAQLLTGSMTGADIIMQFLGSVEFANRHVMMEDLVTLLYRTMLGREPEEAGKQNWLAALVGGNQVSAIVNGFSGSPEFTGICAGYGINPGSINTRTAPHVHTWGLYRTVTPPTCTMTGIDYHICHAYGCGEIANITTAATGHKSQPMTDTASTCSVQGHTGGTECSVCKAILTAPTYLPLLAHTPMASPDVPATCTVAGHTGGTECSVCHTVIIASVPIPATGHSWTPVPGDNPMKQVCSVCAETTVSDTSNYRALLIGNGTYASASWRNLQGPYTDLRKMQTMLNSINAGKYSGRIMTVQDVPSASNLQTLISSALVSGADANTVSYFYYSGHGFPGAGIVMANGDLVTYKNLADWLYTVPGKVIVVLDCCNSGDSVYVKGAADSNRAVINAFAAADGGIADRSGELRYPKFVVLTACRQDQKSWETVESGEYSGVFTRTLCNIIGTSGRMEADTTGDGFATLAEIFPFVQSLSFYGSTGTLYTQNAMCYPSGSGYPLAYRLTTP